MEIPAILLLLVAVLVLGNCTQHVRYVRPIYNEYSPSDCSDPCLTLDQYSQQAETYFTAGATFLFLAGNHSLQRGINLVNVTDVVFKGKENSSDTYIICWNVTFISCLNVTGLTFEGLTVLPHMHTSALLAVNSKGVLIRNSRFIGGHADRNVSFVTLEILQSDITIANCLFERNRGMTYGGAVFALLSNVTLLRNTFSENQALEDGAAALVLSNSLSLIDGCLFERNHGGGIAAYGSLVIINGNRLIENTGALYLSNSTVSIVSCFFKGNMANAGGAITAERGTLVLNGNVFIENQADLVGGAILAINSSLTLMDSLGNTFINNSAELKGGAICCAYKCELLIGDTTGRFSTKLNQSQKILLQPNQVIFSDNKAKWSGGAILVVNSVALLRGRNILFANNSALSDGGAVFIRGSTVITTSENVHFTNNRAERFGGAIGATNSSISIGETILGYHYFTNNSAGILGGAIYCDSGSLRIDGQNYFAQNRATTAAGAISVLTTALVLSGTAIFTGNHADTVAGAISIGTNSSALFNGTVMEFVNNSAGQGGGAIECSNSRLVARARYSSFVGNKAGTAGGAIHTQNSRATIVSSSFVNNTRVWGAIALATKGEITLHSVNFTGNSNSSVGVLEGTITVSGRTIFTRNYGNAGGAIFATMKSFVFLKGYTLFEYNEAVDEGNGGAISGFHSQVSVSGVAIFVGNRAQTGLGGALHARSTEYVFNGTVNFINNSAKAGGAMYFSSTSTLTLEPHANISTSHNHATSYGGAIYHDDGVIIEQCEFEEGNIKSLGYASALPNCFIDLKELSNISAGIQFTVNSYNDTANTDGSFLYGGLLDQCRMNVYLVNNYLHVEFLAGVVPYALLKDEVFHIESINNITNQISSKPYKLCFCEQGRDNDHDCSGVRTVRVIRGQLFWVSITALAQGKIPTTSSVSAELRPTARLRLNQSSQVLPQHCTDVAYNLYSTETAEELVLYPDGPCHDTGLARAVVNVTLLPCPDAFTQSGEQCVCEERLQAYDAECIIDEEIYIARKAGSKFWMSALYENGSYQGLALYKTCPADYCTNNTVNITLDNLDIQCEQNRGGVLCGACATNHSLMLGSSQCQICSNSYIALILPFAAAGLVLVTFLSVLRLTVATGTINSIILYANIVQANKNIIFPVSSRNILTVFIAWLNLDLGFQTCFYHEMDAYAQTWLQFAFPIYVWILITLIILTSRYSVTVSKLIGHNPIAVLATLLLMSYTKVLKIILEVYSSVELDYPDNKVVTVWLKDANVPYLQSQHLVLTVVTTLILVFLFLPYTLLLLLGYKLYRFSGRNWFMRIKPLLDSYYAPYKTHTRYWTGFLLLVRCALYIVFSYNSLGATSKSLLAIIITFTALMTIAWLSVLIYKNFYANLIEASIYLNLIVLSAATSNNASSPALMYALVGMVFVTMVAVVVHHFHLTYTAKSTLWLKFKARIAVLRKSNLFTKRNTEASAPLVPIDSSSHDPHRIVTETVIDLRELVLESEVV